MPVCGLPTLLECLLNNLMTDSQLTSYKMDGFQEKVTLVLRFGKMADTNGCLAGHSTPVSFRRKSTGQVQRDRSRRQTYISSIGEKTMESRELADHRSAHSRIHCSDLEQNYKTTAAVDHKKEAIHVSQDVNSTQIDTMKDETDKVKGDANKETELLKVDKLNQVNQETTENNNVIGNSKQPTKQKEQQCVSTGDSDYNISKDTSIYVTKRVAQSTDSEHSDRSTTDGLHRDYDDWYTHKECTHNTKQPAIADKENSYNKYLCVDAIERRSIRLSNQVIGKVTTPVRNNNIKKYAGFRFDTVSVIMAETDDLILEYCLDKKKITNFIAKDTTRPSRYEERWLDHVKTWKDEYITYAQERWPEDITIINTALALLKEYIMR